MLTFNNPLGNKITHKDSSSGPDSLGMTQETLNTRRKKKKKTQTVEFTSLTITQICLLKRNKKANMFQKHFSKSLN